MSLSLPGKFGAGFLCLFIWADGAAQQVPHTMTYAPGKSITLSLRADFDINVAATGLRRVRFFAKSPDNRVFATAMHDLADNRLGSILILEGWNPQTHVFSHISTYLGHLRNPNSIAFWTDPDTKESWLYVALTDQLVRYPYRSGDTTPSGPPQQLIKFPDYGLNYKYGGWHLTRTIAVGQVSGATRIFVSIGSSCNYCQEREVARASILSIEPDGKNPKIIAQGVRNAVDLRYIPDADDGSLFATNMGDDHLGDRLPDDSFLKLDRSPDRPANYGWPTCYFANGKAVHDATPLPSIDGTESGRYATIPKSADDDSVYGRQQGVAAAGTNLSAGGGHAAMPDPDAFLGRATAALRSCESVPAPYTWFHAHSSPLGFDYFPESDPVLHNSFLVALHGASHPRIGTGYRVVWFTPDHRQPVDFITGFLTFTNGKGVVHGRPCGLFRIDADAFLIADDYLGVIYYVRRR